MTSIALLAPALLAAAASQDPAPPAPRPADEIVREFDANPSPGFVIDRSPEEGEKLIRERLTKQCECAWELFEGHPGHARLPELLLTRFMNQLNFFEDLARVRDDARTILRRSRRPELRRLARFGAAQAALRDESVPAAEVERAVEEALAEPGELEGFDGWRPLLVWELATARIADPERQRALLERARAQAGGGEVEEMIERALRPLERIGEPLELEFDDALGSGRFDLAEQRGRYALVHVSFFVWGDPGRQFASIRAALPRLAETGVAVASTVTVWAGEDPAEELARSAGVSWPLEVATDSTERPARRPLGLDPPAFVLVDGEGRVAGIYARLAPVLDRIAAAPARPRRRSF